MLELCGLEWTSLAEVKPPESDAAVTLQQLAVHVVPQLWRQVEEACLAHLGTVPIRSLRHEMCTEIVTYVVVDVAVCVACQSWKW